MTSLGEHLVMKYRVLFEQDEDGIFVATCPALQDAFPGQEKSGGAS
jgi:hypothetical protein